jgi:hypothetical protein
MQCTVICGIIFHHCLSMYAMYPFGDRDFRLTVKILKLYLMVDLKKKKNFCHVTGRFNVANPEVSH